MKKTSILFAVVALVASAACNKVQQAETPSVKVNITVQELDPGTKAVKTKWEDGDIINVFFQGTSSTTPDFTLTRDGSSWKASTLSDEVIATLEANPAGKLKGFWEASNGTGGWTMNDNMTIAWSPREQYRNEAYDFTPYLTTYFNEIDYSYTSGTLTANISGWNYATNIQIVVTGIPEEPGNYTLGASDIIYAMTSITIAPNVNNGTTQLRTGGIANTDGVAFVAFLRPSYESTDPQSITLNLIDNKANKIYSVTNPSAILYSNYRKQLCAIKIPFAAFKPI